MRSNFELQNRRFQCFSRQKMSDVVQKDNKSDMDWIKSTGNSLKTDEIRVWLSLLSVEHETSELNYWGALSCRAKLCTYPKSKKRKSNKRSWFMEYDYDYYYGSGSSSSSGELDTQKLCDEIFVIYEKLKASFILWNFSKQNQLLNVTGS